MHICRHRLRLRRLGSVILPPVLRVVVANLDAIEDMAIISSRTRHGDHQEVNITCRHNFVHISRIALGADIVTIIILRPTPSRETRDTGNRPVTVVNFSILMRLPMGQVRALVRRIVTIPPSISIRKVGAEEDIEICQCFASFEHLLSFDAENIWILVLGYCECCSTRIILDCTCTAENIA